MDYDKDFVTVSGYVNGKALVGVDMWANFSGQTSRVLRKVYAHLAAGMSAITGSSISGEITALAAIKLAYEYNKFIVQGSINMSRIYQTVAGYLCKRKYWMQCPGIKKYFYLLL